VEAHAEKWFQELEMNYQQWEERVWKRLKEHCESGGYYQPGENFNYSDFKNKVKELKKLKDGNYFTELSPFMKQENFQILFSYKHFLQEVDRIDPGEPEGEASEEEKKHNEKYYFVIADLWGRLNEAQQKKEQAERERERERETIPAVPLSLVPPNRIVV
jgi:hypothetical protein